MLDIEILRLIWWALIGVILMGFAVTDGFDFGVAILSPLVARTEMERRIVLNTIGPFWEGNQVWIILGAGAIFAAWPFVYAVAFSGFYLLILLLLLTMGISRPVSFKYRSKLPNHFWRRFWDWMVFIGGFFPALIFGLLIGNTLEGVPFYLDNDLRIFYTGSFFDLFNPFALWCAFTSLAMLSMHGGLYLALKTTPPIRERAIRYAKWMAVLFLLLFAGGGIWIAHSVHGFEVVSGVDPFGYSNPLHKTIATNLGAWLKNYSLHPYTMLAPVIGLLGGLGVILTARLRSAVLAFIFSSFAIMGVIATVGVSMFPFILPSSTNFSSSLLVWDASSSQLTLLLMLIAVIIFLPLILFYTAWVYRSLSGVVDRKMIEQDENHIAY